MGAVQRRLLTGNSHHSAAVNSNERLQLQVVPLQKLPPDFHQGFQEQEGHSIQCGLLAHADITVVSSATDNPSHTESVGAPGSVARYCFHQAQTQEPSCALWNLPTAATASLGPAQAPDTELTKHPMTCHGKNKTCSYSFRLEIQAGGKMFHQGQTHAVTP